MEVPISPKHLPTNITAKFEELEALGLDLINLNDEME
jgi:hypothetical protein